MKTLLTLALLAHFSVAHADECDLNQTYPAGELQLAFEATGFRWAGPAELAPFGIPLAGSLVAKEETCVATVGASPRNPTGRSSAVVHTARPSDHLWKVDITRADAIDPDSNGFPFWSLQMVDSSSASYGVVTATLFPGLKRIGVSVTQRPVDGAAEVQTAYLRYDSAPLCAKLSFQLVTAANGGKQLLVALNCLTLQPQPPAFSINSSLYPQSVRYGKLSADEGPNGYFTFRITRSSNPN